ncbi:DUF2207 family protein [Naumannella huperziae]
MIAKRARRARLLIPLALLAWFVALLPAQAAPGDVATMDVQARLEPSGLLYVEQTLTFDGSPPAELTQRIATRESTVGDADYVYTISDVTARAGDRDLAPRVNPVGDAVEIVVPTEGVTGPVTMSYRVAGAVQGRIDGEQLTWRMLQGLSVPVGQITGEVRVPGLFRSLDCKAGPPNATASCRSFSGGTGADPVPTFTDGPRGAGEVVTVQVLFPPGAVEVNEQLDYRWTLGRAFSAGPLQLGLAAALLALGGIAVYLLHRRTGVDRAGGTKVIAVAEFVPVGKGEADFRVTSDVRPGEVGSLVDERVDPIDVVATVVDLAVRGHLLITELPARSAYAAADWSFTRRDDADDDSLQPYERRLLDAVAPADGTEVLVSNVGSRVNDAIAEVQSELYGEMVANGWYERRPDSTRNVWHRGALIFLVGAVALTAVLAAFTTFGLVGLAAILLGLGLLFVAQEMPARTPKGTATLRGLEVLAGELQTRPTDEAPKGKELATISKLLPYAVVLGGAERWVDAMVAADDDPDEPDPTDLSWYHAPDTWYLRDLPDSLRNFLVSLAGQLFSR